MKNARRLTEGMSVRETQEWIAERRKNIKTMSWEEINDFNRELELIQAEEESKMSYKVEKILKIIFVWIGAAIVIVISLSNRLFF